MAVIFGQTGGEFVLHFPAAKDLRVTGLSESDREEICNMIKLRYMIKQPKKTLMLFQVPQSSLKQYAQDNSKYSFINLPDNKYRLFADEFKGSEDVEKEKEENEQD